MLQEPSILLRDTNLDTAGAPQLGLWWPVIPSVRLVQESQTACFSSAIFFFSQTVTSAFPFLLNGIPSYWHCISTKMLLLPIELPAWWHSIDVFRLFVEICLQIRVVIVQILLNWIPAFAVQIIWVPHFLFKELLQAQTRKVPSTGPHFKHNSKELFVRVDHLMAALLMTVALSHFEPGFISIIHVRPLPVTYLVAVRFVMYSVKSRLLELLSHITCVRWPLLPSSIA